MRVCGLAQITPLAYVKRRWKHFILRWSNPHVLLGTITNTRSMNHFCDRQFVFFSLRIMLTRCRINCAKLLKALALNHSTPWDCRDHCCLKFEPSSYKGCGLPPIDQGRLFLIIFLKLPIISNFNYYQAAFV